MLVCTRHWLDRSKVPRWRSVRARVADTAPPDWQKDMGSSGCHTHRWRALGNRTSWDRAEVGAAHENRAAPVLDGSAEAGDKFRHLIDAVRRFVTVAVAQAKGGNH